MSPAWTENFKRVRRELNLTRVTLAFHEDDSVFFSTKVGEYQIVLPLADVLGKSVEQIRTLLYEALLDLVRTNNETSFSVWIHRSGDTKAAVAQFLSKELGIDLLEATHLINNTPCRVFRTTTRRLAVDFARGIRNAGADIHCSWE